MLDQSRLNKFNSLIAESRVVKGLDLSNARINQARKKIAGTGSGVVSLVGQPSHLLVKVDNKHNEENYLTTDSF